MDVKLLISYLQDLRDNNNKEWFEANRRRYDDLRSQFLAMLGELIEKMSRFDPAVSRIDPASAMFRIYRDVRFSKDKSPYKTAFSALLRPGTKSSPQPGYYVMLHSDDELILGAGMHEPSPEQLAVFRQSIDKHGKKLQDTIDDPTFQACFHALHGEQLKNVPREYASVHPYADFLKYKSITVEAVEKASVLDGGHLPAHIAATYAAAYPFVRVLREFVN